MTTQPPRAKWWREVAEGEDIHPDCPVRIEQQTVGEPRAVEFNSHKESFWQSSSPTIFIDSRWRRSARPLKVGCSISNETRLEKLPDGSVVIDQFGNAWQGRTDRSCATKLKWMLVGFTFGESSELLLQRFGPVTLIYLPEGAGR